MAMDSAMTPLIFKENQFLSMGVELELQLINLQTFNLAMEAKDLLRRLSEIQHPGEIKPEITQAMIEINSSPHNAYASLLDELITVRDIITRESQATYLGLCGGGAHPFQKWKEQRIFPLERFSSVSEQYGFLAKQFTVFGQHIHVGCQNGDDALYLCHALVPYLPHFIALSAASPFNQGVDTAFDCSRLTIISAFPLSGTPPWIFSWEEFKQYFHRLQRLGIVNSMKDFYWDIRPKPEYGTIEIRICDTPLTVEKSADLAAYAQLLVCWLLDKRPVISHDIYLSYLMNRFYAARYGLNATIINPVEEITKPLSDDILNTCEQLDAYAESLHCTEALTNIRQAVITRENGAQLIRLLHDRYHSLADTVRAQAELWLNTALD